MASSVQRAMAKAAAALLPGLLQTPPLMITPSPCIIILPAAPNPKFPKPGRADAVERWDAHKNRPRSPASSCGSTSPGRADSCERWDMKKNKQSPINSSSTSSSMSSRGSSAISGERYKRPPSRASSADRWDTHKKPRDALSDAESQTSEDKEQQKKETTEMEEKAPARTHLVFSGPSFVASPEPSMLPMPAFFPRRAGVLPVPAFVQAH